MMHIRIDVYMVQKGLAPSRTKAQDLIRAKLVSVRKNGQMQLEESSSFQINESAAPEIVIQQSCFDRYVSRAGIKMEGALEHLNLVVTGFQILDVGISTGGFADCLLQAGAGACVGIDVGHGQLSPRLKLESRLHCLEGVNAREMSSNERLMQLTPVGGFDLAVIDVSFISLTLVLPEVIKSVSLDRGRVLALVKPQFEVGPAGLGKNGIVQNQAQYLVVEQKIRKCVDDIGGKGFKYFQSKIEGKDGNKEFFVYFTI